jgi:hypothetical protein
MNYEQKYLKYKTKYLNLKSILGGHVITSNKSVIILLTKEGAKKLSLDTNNNLKLLNFNFNTLTSELENTNSYYAPLSSRNAYIIDNTKTTKLSLTSMPDRQFMFPVGKISQESLFIKFIKEYESLSSNIFTHIIYCSPLLKSNQISIDKIIFLDNTEWKLIDHTIA